MLIIRGIGGVLSVSRLCQPLCYFWPFFCRPTLFVKGAHLVVWRYNEIPRQTIVRHRLYASWKHQGFDRVLLNYRLNQMR